MRKYSESFACSRFLLAWASMGKNNMESLIKVPFSMNLLLSYVLLNCRPKDVRLSTKAAIKSARL